MPERETQTIDIETAWGSGPGQDSGLVTTRDSFEDLELLFGDPGRIVLEKTGRLRSGAYPILVNQPGNTVMPIDEHDAWGDVHGKSGRHEFDGDASNQIMASVA